MARKNEEEVILTLVDQFTATAQKVRKEADNLKGAFASLKAGIVGLVVGAGIKEAVSQFAEQEKVTAQLSYSLRTLGITSQIVTKNYMDFAKEMSRSTMFTDEQVASSERLFVQMGLVGDTMRRAVKASADLATTQGTDLFSASEKVLLAFQGQARGLRSVVGELDKNKMATDSVNTVLEALEKNLHGIAQAATDTTSGKLNQLSKAFDDIAKSAGAMVMTMEKKTGVMGYLTRFFNTVSEQLEGQDDLIEKNYRRQTAIRDQQADIDKYLVGEATDGNVAKSLRKQREDLEDEYKHLEDSTAAHQRLLNALDARAQHEESKVKPRVGTANQPKEFDTDSWLKTFARGRKESNAFLDQLVEKNGNVWQQITAQTEAATKKADKYYYEDFATFEEYQQMKTEISKQQIAQQINAASSGMDAITSAVKGDFMGMATQVGHMFGPLGDSIVGGFKSAFGLVKGIMGLFAKDTRSEFKKTVDYIEEVKKASQRALAEMESYFDDAAMREDHRLGDVSTDEGIASQLLSDAGGSIGARSKPSDVANMINSEKWTYKVVESSKGPLIQLIGNDDVVATYNPRTNEIFSRFSDISHGRLSGSTMELFERLMIQKAIASGANMQSQNQASAAETSAPTKSGYGYQYAEGGLVPGNSAREDMISAKLSGGEFVVSRKGVTAKSLRVLRALNNGSAGGMGDSHVYISAIDAASFEEFMVRDGAKVLRKITGRDGVVIANSRGVSANS